MFLTQALYAPEAVNTTDFLILGSPWSILLFWLLLINLVTFLVFGADKGLAKWKAKKESIRRVPEKVLFLLAILGGSLGALLGMQVFRHKTLHKSFRFGIPAILFLQIFLPFGFWIYWNFCR